MMPDFDAEIRMTAFKWLSERIGLYGDVLPRSILSKGFDFRGTRVPLVGPQGIFKPKVLSDMPLSITTSPKGPYDDSFAPDGFLLYKYRGTNPYHHENVGLRNACIRNKPLIYFHGVVPGKYLAVWPVFVVADYPDDLCFKIAVDDITYVQGMERANQDNLMVSDSEAEARRSYITYGVRQRLHQRGFRERVLDAYNDKCALCRLRHRELLDAAHIVPDNEPKGEPTVRNGIALCKLHHAAFDNFFFGIRPDLIVEVRKDVLEESDGPMLRHGLQGLHKIKLNVPRKINLSPDPELLNYRWEKFRNVA